MDDDGLIGVGTVLADRYRLDEFLGRGATARVFKAHDLRLERAVAVKVFHPDLDTVGQRRFADETRALAALSHPGLVSIYDANTDLGRNYLVMRLVVGRTLRERLRDGPLGPEETTVLGERLAGALAHVHRHGIVHRDVKPSNILLDASGLPHLTDFGIARLVDATRLTQVDEVIGTAAYLAPEQVRGQQIGPAADRYALGLVLLECLTGRIEYPGGDVEAAVARLHRDPVIPPNTPPALAATLRALTARDPGLRPASLRAPVASASVVDTLAGGPLVPPPPDNPQTMEFPAVGGGSRGRKLVAVGGGSRGRKLVAFGGAATVVVALLSWAAFTALSGQPGTTGPDVANLPATTSAQDVVVTTGDPTAGAQPIAGTTATHRPTTKPSTHKPPTHNPPTDKKPPKKPSPPKKPTPKKPTPTKKAPPGHH